MSLLVQDAAGVSLQEQVCRQIRGQILQGNLGVGQRLPASRALAAELGVARVTVEAAYARLEAEGYVSRKVGAGTFVAIDVLARFPVRASGGTAIAGPSQRGLSMQRTTLKAEGNAGLRACIPDMRAFPHEIWNGLQARILRQDSHNALMEYGDPQGCLPLRQAIAAYLAQSRGVRCHAGQVMILASSQQALQLLALTLLDAGDTAWVEDPGYHGARAALQAAGAVLQPVPLDEEGLAWDATCPSPRMIYVTPSHQYPLGMRMSLARRMALLTLARQHKAWIIEDDYDGEYQYDHKPLPALQGLDDTGCVLYVGTFSKVLFPGLRLAYVVAPESLMPALTSARRACDGHSSYLQQAVTADFIRQGHFGAHLRRMRLLYRSRRDCLLDALAPLADELQLVGFESGLQCAGLLPPGHEARLTPAVRQAGTQLRDLRSAHLGPQRVEGWMLGFAGLNHEEIKFETGRLIRTVQRELAKA
ncbi:GntR family transcriptional regulator/MocR family aminotransferase [Silvimonas terrae]|uniref:Putative 8-amino-7-oxononanoate synthase n=1 Tax=Silvimonas terrae TaxID=300266 RepID=A0A840RJA9_9NEIS|nr:PLP-dependent aminotransferase family protein [Silvimonas terrae]MBB5192570.1 GntR family transcriptional regulator/MocR family aminotransferase [Silvimonas terrae]